MKTLLLFILFLFVFLSVFSQRKLDLHYIEISKTKFKSCEKTHYLINNKKIKKLSGKLVIPTSYKKPRVFVDTNSHENFREFEYLGEIKGSTFCIIKMSGYTNEEFYFINKSTNRLDTLIGLPIFSSSLKYFVCLNNPGTDEDQQIQVGEINNGIVKTVTVSNVKNEIYFEEATCISRNSCFAKDNKGKYWKLSFEPADK